MEWAYKATQTKLDGPATLLLAKRGFLCCSAFEPNLSWADNVRSVAIGDVIHFYYVPRQAKAKTFGAFEVIEAANHLNSSVFGERVPDTALYRLADAAFIREIDTAGAYTCDPKLGAYTGWVLSARGPARGYDRNFFPAHATLVPLDD